LLPPYYPAPLVDTLALKEFPQIETALRKLSNIMSLSEAVDLLRKSEQVLHGLKTASERKRAIEDIARLPASQRRDNKLRKGTIKGGENAAFKRDSSKVSSACE
jgi:hypothetical protein